MRGERRGSESVALVCTDVDDGQNFSIVNAYLSRGEGWRPLWCRDMLLQPAKCRVPDLRLQSIKPGAGELSTRRGGRDAVRCGALR